MLVGDMDLSIIIVSFNTKDLTCECLQSIYDQTKSVSFEVWVVDNDSCDGSADMIEREFPQVHLIRSGSNIGVAAAANIGLKASTGRYVLTLNSDTVIVDGAMDRLVCFMDTHPDAGGATGRLIRPDGSEHPKLFGNPPTLKLQILVALSAFHKRFADIANSVKFGEYDDYSRTQHVPCVWWGTCFIVRREAMEQAGMQDPRFFIYSEDVDWAMNIVKAGWKLYYVSDAEVIHYGGQSTKQASVKMMAMQWKNACRLIQKHYGFIFGTILRLVVAAVFGIRMIKWLVLYPIRRGMQKKEAFGISHMWAVIRGVLTY